MYFPTDQCQQDRGTNAPSIKSLSGSCFPCLWPLFFSPAVLNSLGVIRMTFNFRFVLYPHSFSKDMVTAQQARRKDKITGGRRAIFPSKLPPSKNRQIREPKQRRRRRQRERQKRNVLSKQNNNYAFWYISLPSLHDCDVNCPIKMHVL